MFDQKNLQGERNLLKWGKLVPSFSDREVRRELADGEGGRELGRCLQLEKERREGSGGTLLELWAGARESLLKM